MRNRVLPVVLAACALCSTALTLAQSTMRPTPAPSMTAENQPWYSSGGPIAYGRSIYYPSGPIVHFSSNEMVQTGTFDGVPVYVRTTREPGSVIYVPLPGGVMRPYERRRSGDLAGTVGSTAPAFPVMLVTAEAGRPTADLAQTPADPLRPVGTSGFIMTGAPASAAAREPEPVATVGAAALPSAPALPMRLETAHKPSGLNGIYVEFEEVRWFAAGAAVEFDPARFTRVGAYRGFPVFSEAGRDGIIFVSLIGGEPGLLAPYSKR